MRGRKPKPTRIKELAGNPGKRPLNKNEPGASGLPECPDCLDRIGKAEWERTEPLLRGMLAIGAVDSAALAAYCSAYSDWVKASRALNKRGALTIVTEKGAEVPAPEIRIRNSALDLMRKFMTEFGMTPSSRARLAGAGAKPAKDDNPFEALASEANAVQ